MPETASIPGLSDLWRLTKGDPRLRVAVLDGPAALDHPAFRGANVRRLRNYWVAGTTDIDEGLVGHATHVCSVVFGRHETGVLGLAPDCTGLNIPVQTSMEVHAYDMVRAIDLARDAGAHIIHVAVVQPTRSGTPDSLLERAIRTCLDEGILVISPVGNDRGECWTMPAAIPGVLAVGAMKDDGQPFQFSNYGGVLQRQGVLAPGENVLGADPLGGLARQKGTSCAAPIVTGVAALLMSLQLRQGRAPSADEVRRAILETALPCDPAEVAEPERCLRGKLNVSGAVRAILGPDRAVLASGLPVETAAPLRPDQKRLVFALGSLGYDFGTESRRDLFRARMAPVEANGTIVPPNPHDPRQTADHLARNPSEARSLLWTLHQDGTPVYALKPVGPFGPDVYEALRLLLEGQVAGLDDEDRVERVSVPGVRTDRQVRLLSGQDVPLLKLTAARGVYGWRVDSLIEDALAGAAPDLAKSDAVRLREALRGFLRLIYDARKNPGMSSKDRALNFAVTNAFQAAQAFARADAEGRRLKDFEVVKSPVCRLHSDCWDLKLKFYDPENGGRAKRICRLTIDVSDLLPVTLGEVRTWMTRD